MRSYNKTFFRAICAGLFFILFVSSGFAAEKSGKELIQLAILLDTSGSMDGLINQAKSQLWKIVNELATAKRNGASPALEVALYEYGNDGISAGEGHMRMLLPLTDDLDSVSEKLFSLTTNGGEEYCGAVIDRAVRALKWDTGKDTLKLVFIAGNEPFTQGNVDYRDSCKRAISKGIIVNTIFCGNMQEGVETNWKDGAVIADGKYMNIDQNQAIAYMEAPQDKEIARLGAELNRTYIAYGSMGESKKERQAREDYNAGSVSMEAVVQRAAAKSAPQYKNSEWDLVDAVRDDKIELEKMDKDMLPAEMRNMNAKERKEYLNKMTGKRADIQKQLQKLNEDRRRYVEKEMKKQTGNTLDAAVIKAVREEAERKNFKFN